VADVFDRYFDDYRAGHGVSRQQLKAVGAIRKCRTAALSSAVNRSSTHFGAQSDQVPDGTSSSERDSEVIEWRG
jgi:hypothetical protein